jgi:aldehyde dehydrogenase (NAD+)
MSAVENLYIGGQWVRSSNRRWLDVVCPATEKILGRVPVPSFREVDSAVAAGRDAFDKGPWPRLSVNERAQYLQQAMKVFDYRCVDSAVRLQTDETGTPASFTRAATTSLSPFLERVIDDAAGVTFSETRRGIAGPIRVLQEPIGVAAGVIPWNAPLMSAVTKLFPALLMGCPVVLKTAPESPLSSYLLAEALMEANLPPGVVSIIAGDRDIGQYLVAHPQIDMVAFTGSTQSGRQIASICGHQLKPVLCQLGSKSAAIFAPGVNLQNHLPTLLADSLSDSGQLCAASRLLVHTSQADELREALVDAVSAMKVGDPHDPDTALGPLVSRRQRDRVEGYVASGKAQGATLAYGGTRPKHLPVGYYVSPTIFSDVTSDMAIARDEIPGPVLCIISYDTEADAIAIGNDSNYGLGGSVYAEDPEHALGLAAQLQTGTCAVNDAPSDGDGGPSRGHKHSGLGVEGGPEGLRQYLQPKSITLPASWSSAGS